MARLADGGGGSVTLTPTQIKLQKAQAAAQAAQNNVNLATKSGSVAQKAAAALKLTVARDALNIATQADNAASSSGTSTTESDTLRQQAADAAAAGDAQLAKTNADAVKTAVDKAAAEKAAADASAAAKATTDKATADAAAKAAAAKASQDKADAAATTKAKADQALTDLINQKGAADAAQIAAVKAEQAAANAALAQAAAELATVKAAADAAAKAAADAAIKAKADADALLADATAKGDAIAAAAAKAAQAAAAKAAEEAAAAARTAAAQLLAQQQAAAAAAAGSNINVSGNTVIPGAFATKEDLAAAVDKATAAAAAKADQAAAQQAADTAAALEAKKLSDRASVIETMKARFTQYNLGALGDKITALAIDGANEATITIALQETPEYKARFAANEARLKNNLQVLAPKDYLNAEDSYRQVLSAYGLNQFATDDYVKQFIENDVNAQEMNTRVATAVNRIQNADPATMKLLRENYGIKATDLIAYTLDPKTNINTIQQQISGAEISNAGQVQGLTVGSDVADQLVTQGVTQAQAQKGYASIAGILPTAEKLSGIYSGMETGYTQSTGEQEVFNQLASAQRVREKLSAREIANFSGSSGTNKASLAAQKQGTI